MSGRIDVLSDRQALGDSQPGDADLDVLLVGEALVDFISIEVADSLTTTARFERHMGGSPANIALNVAKLGGRSAVICKTGIGAFGQYIRNELRRYGVLTEYMIMDHRVRTTVVFVARTAGTPDFEVARQGDAQLRPLDVPEEAIARARLVHASTFALSAEPSRSAVRHALELARTHGKLVSLDPNYHPAVWPNLFEARSVLSELYPVVDLTKPSLDDAERLFGPGRAPEEYAQKFREMGAKTVVLTMGAQGVLLSHGDCIERFPPRPVDVLDATGAGDAFWAGYLMAMLDGNDPVRCVRFAQEVVGRKLVTVGPLPASLDRADLYAGLA